MLADSGATRGRGLMASCHDDFSNLLVMQMSLMQKVPHEVPAEVIPQITAGLGVIEETLEYLNSIGRKPWRPQPQPQDEQLEELVDILFFYLELIILSPFSWFQIVGRYKQKHKENLERYEKGSKGDYSWDKRSERREL